MYTLHVHENVGEYPAAVRICEYGGYSCTSHPAVTDERAHHWAAGLLPAVRDSCSNIFSPDTGCPPAPTLGSPY